MIGERACIILYRGPLERARLAFIIESMQLCYTEVRLFWIFPGTLSKDARGNFEKYIAPFNVNPVVLEFRLDKFVYTVQVLKEKIRQFRLFDLCLVGFSAPFFSLGLKRKHTLWFINGIPEEKQMRRKGIIFKIIPFSQWLALRSFFKPDVIITVSKRMTNLVARYLGNGAMFIEAPCCADLTLFRKPSVERKGYFTYLGTGAPWQAIDLLRDVWGEIHQLDKNIKFRVISRDERTRILGKNISTGSIDFVSSNDFDQVAEYLNESEVGFVIRRDSLINRVSFPTKIGEYLASGCSVVTTNLDWDVSEYIKSFEAGILVQPDDTPKEMASKIVKWHHIERNNGQLQLAIANCAAALDRTSWKNKIQTQILSFMKKNSVFDF